MRISGITAALGLLVATATLCRGEDSKTIVIGHHHHHHKFPTPSPTAAPTTEAPTAAPTPSPTTEAPTGEAPTRECVCMCM